MLKWLSKNLGSKKKSTHPLGSAQSLREIIADLPAGNDLRALAEIGDWLVLTDQVDIDPPDRIHAIRTLDESASSLTREVMFEYLSLAPTHHRAEQTWFTLTTYYAQVFNACSLALRDLFGDGRAFAKDKAMAAMFVARAMAAINERRKLLRMRYRAVEPTLWGDLYRMYLLAEELGVARRSVRLPGSSTDTSAHREFVVAMWFELAPISNLDHMQMQYLDRVVRELFSFFSVREGPDTETPFFVDLAQGGPPQRWNPESRARRAQIFLGPGKVYAQLVSLAREIRRTQTLPGYMEMEGIGGVQSCVTLVEKLVLHWSKTPPRRAYDRTPQQQPLQVVHGYREIRRLIAGVAYLRFTEGKTRDELSSQQREEFGRYGFVTEARDSPSGGDDEIAKVRAMLEAQNRKMTVEWILTDLSEFGGGAIAQSSGNWLQVGILLGLRWGGQEDWQGSVVRRLSRNAQGQAMVGMQRFPGMAYCARIGALDKRQVSVFERSSDPGVSVYFDAISLLEDNSVLIEPGVYLDSGRFRLVIGSKRWTIQFTQLLERGLDFEHVRYEIQPDPA